MPNYKISEFFIGKNRLDNLSTDIEANNIESAIKIYISNYYKKFGYPHNHNIYIQDDDNIYSFSVQTKIALEIKNSGQAG